MGICAVSLPEWIDPAVRTTVLQLRRAHCVSADIGRGDLSTVSQMPCSCQETTRILKWVLVATAPSSEGAIRAVSVPERILDIATRMLQPRLAHVSSAGIEQGAMVLQRKSAHAFSTQLDQGDLWQLAQ